MRLLQCLVGVYLLAVSNVLCRGLTSHQDYVVTREDSSRDRIPKDEWVSNHMVHCAIRLVYAFSLTCMIVPKVYTAFCITIRALYDRSSFILRITTCIGETTQI